MADGHWFAPRRCGWCRITAAIGGYALVKAVLLGLYWLWVTVQ